uniref:Jnk:sapk associated protein n=1 Tax=Echinococcus granulosus TaxID=6210 RepID=A0A068WVT1_ECHGR|nr:jnk:sapk associated protein [Echinococcus granulosus]
MSESQEFLEADLISSHFSNENDVNLHNLSLDVCAEFEKIVEEFGKDSFLTLGSLVARAMDTLHDVYKQRDRIIGELDRLKHDHALLITKYETERTESKILGERVFDLEDALQDKHKVIEELKSSSASTKKLLEMKLKNASDHISRLEERDRELQTTYANLRQRYGELFRAHVELTERLRTSAADGDNIPTSSSTKFKVHSSEPEACSSTTTAVGAVNPLMFISHKGDSPYDWGIQHQTHHDSEDIIPEIALDADGSPFSKLSADENYDDNSNSEEADTSLPSLLKDNNTKEFNASKEVSKLVNDFNELEKTNNALKIVINDLLTNTEELNSEKIELKETLSQMQIARSSMLLHIKQLEEDNTRLKRELAEAQDAQKQLVLNETPFSKRTRFTREEMAKVLMERIQLQEDVCNLREKLSIVSAGRYRDGSDGTQVLTAGSNRFMIFFSRLFQRHGRRSAPTVSFDTSTSGISMDFGEGRLFDAEVAGLTSSRNNNAVKAACSSESWWLPLPITPKPCAPEPVVMQSASVRRASEAAKSNHSSPSLRPPPLPPLPQLLYRRPFSEALSGQMRLTCVTCLFSDIGALLPSGELLAGRSLFFTPTATVPTQSSIGENLSSQLWTCLVGVSDTATLTTTNSSAEVVASSAVDSKPSLCSQVVVVDANAPSRYVDSFFLRRSIVTCMAAVPGAKKLDYEVLRLLNSIWESIPLAEGSTSASSSYIPHPSASGLEETTMAEVEVSIGNEDEDCTASIQTSNTLSSLHHFVASAGKAVQGELLLKVLQQQQQQQFSMVNSIATTTSQRTSAFEPDIHLEGKPGDFYRVERQRFKKISTSSAAISDTCSEVIWEAASAQQTVWLGCQNGDVFVHSCDSTQRRPLLSTRLPSGVVAICHFSGRVFISLVDGHIVVFRRQLHRPETQPPAPRSSTPLGEGHVTTTQQPCNQLSIREELSTSEAAGAWSLAEAVVIRCAPTGQFAIKALAVVESALTLWAAYRNRIIVIDATTFQRLHTIEVVPNASVVVRNLCWTRDGVWISIRKDFILRLFNAFTYEPMQELNLAYIIYETVGAPNSQLQLNSMAVSAIGVSPNHLWIGTNGGHVVCVPFIQTPPSSTTLANSCSSDLSHGAYVKSDCGENALPLSAQVDLSGTAVSRCGHAEAVSSFTLTFGNMSSTPVHATTSSTPINATKAPSTTSNSQGLLMISGGVGYLEHHRDVYGAKVTEKRITNPPSHLLVWSLSHEHSIPS